MDPVASAAASALKAVGGALVSRYRPVGVARVGSPEDRAQTYRRFLDAANHYLSFTMLSFIRLTEGKALGGFDQALRDAVEVDAEFSSALAAVQLCGTLPVIMAAEAAYRSAPKISETTGEAFTESREAFESDLRGFLDAARQDLAYQPRWWQVLRKRRERAVLAEFAARSLPQQASGGR